MKALKFKNNLWFLLLVLLVALIFRFFQINSKPISLNWDETTFAYNAFSIWKTGRDEYGNKFPLSFRSIGDYKCPAYIYLMSPLVGIFGLTEWTVRFWPSLLGTLSVGLFFLIVFEFFKDRNLALLSALVLAISPWHLQFTRAGADVSVSSFFLILGIWLFLRSINRRSWVLLSISFTSFVLTFYSYYGERFFTPLILAVLLFYFRREIWVNKEKYFFSLILPIALFVPIFSSLVSSGHQGKILMTTIFGYQRPDEYLQKVKKEDSFRFIFNLFHNVPAEYGLAIADRYLNHFSPSFLFSKGPQDNRQRIEGMGMLYWSDFIFLAIALVFLREAVRKQKNWGLVILWLAISPLPAAITRDTVHARRAFNMVYPLSILVGFGILTLIKTINGLKNKFIKGIVIFLPIGLFVWSFSLYLLSYFVLTPLKTYAGPGGWQYGYKQLVTIVSPLKSKYKQIIIDTSYQGPYIYFLFFEQYPPALYQPQAELVRENSWSLGEGKGYDNYHFRPIYWPADRGLSKTLFAGSPERIPLQDIDPKQSRLLDKIFFPDGKVAFHIVETF